MFRRLLRRKPKFYAWINPDGSLGGDVSSLATIDPNATIERFSIVLSGTVLGPDAHVRMGDMVDGDRVIRFGPEPAPSRPCQRLARVDQAQALKS